VPLFQDDSGGDSPAPAQDFKEVGFLDQSGAFPDMGGDDGPLRFETAADGLQAVAGGDIETFYVITADYLETGVVEQFARFEGRFPSNPRGETAFSTLLLRELVAEQVDPAVLPRVFAPATFQSYRVEDNASTSELTPTAEAVGGLLVPLLFAGLLALGLTMGCGHMVQTVSEEKESRLVEVVITSASPSSVMAGKLLALVTIGLAQAAVWIIAAALTMPIIFEQISGGAEFTISAGLWATIIGCFITGYFLTATLAILLGAVAPSNREASRLGGWIPVITFVPFWFVGVLIWQPDGWLARLLFYIPFTAPTGILVRIGVGGDVTASDIAVALLGVVVTAVVFYWMSARVFRAAILMRGQSLTRHNLWAALRRAD
jgi:ABC-2 type transport system permease protein